MNSRLLLVCALSLLAAPLLAGCASDDPASGTSPTPSPASISTPTVQATTLATPATTSPATSTPAPTMPVKRGPATVDLGSAAGFAILAKSGVSTVPASAVTGDVGTSPIDSTGVTGFSLTMDATNRFATSPQVTGKVYAADYADPTPATLTSAVGDMQAAYTDAAGRSDPDATELGAGEIGGLTLAPGLYKWGTGVLVTTDVTLDAQGNPDATWIFQVAQDLTVANGQRVVLAGGAQAANVFWQVAGHADVGTGAHFEGNLLGQTAITLKSGATMNGRALAQTAVTLDAATVTRP